MGRGPGTNGGIDRHWVYVGGQIAAELDGAERERVYYAYEPGADRPYAAVPPGGGGGGREVVDVVGQVDAWGAVPQQVTYTAWGKPTVQGTGPNALLWKGLLWEDTVGLYYVRNRWYDPEVGRFLSEDPIGLEGGMNMYVFGNNDPINFSDPSGLKVCFRGSDQSELVSVLQRTTSTTFGLDGDNCVSSSSVMYSGGSAFAGLQDIFRGLVNDGSTHILQFLDRVSQCPDGGSCTSPFYGDVSYISRFDTGRRYRACNSERYPAGGTTSLESSIAHEFLGHQSEGVVYKFFGTLFGFEGHALDVENLYHQAVGEVIRCGHGPLQ